MPANSPYGSFDPSLIGWGGPARVRGTGGSRGGVAGGFDPYARQSAGPVSLKDAIDGLSVERQSFMPNRVRSLASQANAGDRGAAEVRTTANMAAALNNQAPVTSFSDALGSAERRAKIRQGIVNRGDAAVRNQQLKDRLAIAKGQVSRRGDLINTLQTAANIREGVNAGLSDANNAIRQSNAGMWGNIAGGAARFGKEWWNNRSPAGVTQQSMDMGTSTADLISQPLWDPSTTMVS